MARHAAIKPQSVSPHEVRDIAEQLSDRCGFGSWRDASMIVQRIVSLTHEGETATSIMRRLNPPANTDNHPPPIKELAP